MKTRDKLILSILAGLAAMVLYASPMWWVVVFSPIAQPLTTSGEAEVRLKSLELLRGLFGQRR